MSRTTRLLTLALAFGVLLVPAAHASPAQTSIMMDDDLLVYRDDDTAAKTLTAMKRLGVDVARVTVLWKTVAENARPTKAEIAKLKGSKKENARKQAARFKATVPKTYPRRNWDRYDNLVRSAEAGRHQDLLQHHRARPGVGARQAARVSALVARIVEAQARGLQAVRDGRRTALRRDLRRRQRRPQHPAARELLVAVERAQPGRLAVSAVGERRSGVAGPVSQAAPVRLPGPVRHRPPQGQRHHPDGRDRPAGDRRQDRQRADAPWAVLARAGHRGRRGR